MAKVDNSNWDAGKAWANGAASDDPAAFYKGICAGEKTSGEPGTQSHWALPHHYHPGDPPNAAGVRNGLSRIGQAQGLANKSAAQKHLDGHMSTIQAAEKASGRAGSVRAAVPDQVRLARAEQAERGEKPGGAGRLKAFPGKLRGQIVERDGKPFYKVTGFATIYDRGYPMWDLFGEYTEVIDGNALGRSLAAGPDVSFLVNHKGVTMARTTNGSLELRNSLTSDGYTGLAVVGYLNPERQDVRDLMSAVGDELVDEMSFAFMLNDGEWNDDYDEFRITEADINRGDVSAVNYGANPFTSIQARTAEILADIERLPDSALSRAQQTIAGRIFRSAAIDLSERSAQRYKKAAEHFERIARNAGLGGVDLSEELSDFADWDVVDEPAVSEEPGKRAVDKSDLVHIPGGKSLSLWKSRLESMKSDLKVSPSGQSDPGVVV